MYNVRKEVHANLGHFRMKNYWFRYSNFVPRLYNWCLKIGLEPGKIMPARAFCSDESQGYPVILLAKHFGVFPFNHGRVGGIMANGRHGPHAHHGKDLLIVQASHVGYDQSPKPMVNIVEYIVKMKNIQVIAERSQLFWTGI